ncbi:hypothetical protein [Streptomyces noursei]|uniref:hypothetical protein n=1 Tax=Streptomyces noursei TaxID=1971 RepID=UPI001674F413|nr:hypothetical protein [Streptomyces noursei]MCZ1021247.1 hypothetical protein [Streptomyces noursei]GGX56918.1 hypothetical protein GCM10010341_91570 [Streptomyces noursei]
MLKRIANKFTFSASTTTQQPPPGLTLTIQGNPYPLTALGDTEGGAGFYKYSRSGAGDVFFDATSLGPRGQAHKTISDSELEKYVVQYFAGDLVLYRGVASWHPKWVPLRYGNPPTNPPRNPLTLEPLGTKNEPNFDTHETLFIPFSPVQAVAAGAAISKTGMNTPRDDIRYVYGYDRTDKEFIVGAVAKINVPEKMAVGFFNATEVQLLGPLTNLSVRFFEMTSLMSDIAPEYPPQPLSDVLPPEPTQAEKNEFITKFGSLLNPPP